MIDLVADGVLLESPREVSDVVMQNHMLAVGVNWVAHLDRLASLRERQRLHRLADGHGLHRLANLDWLADGHRLHGLADLDGFAGADAGLGTIGNSVG